ncbi:kinase binding protein CGI-121-domain-containing protein [Boletus coccyginus]|nr:kinase binding protein CGI-121-domain-containing protein [Boletus coccyginus]
MELLEVYRCPEFIYPVIYAAKFKHVKNAGAIRERIVKASTMEGPEGDKERDAVNFAFINAKLITSPLHLQTAAMQALFAQSAKTMRTKTPHSEIIWNLNPTNNITEGIKRYGVSDATTDLIVMHIAGWEREDILKRMLEVVDGELDLLANVVQVTDWETVIKHYKLDQEPVSKGFTGRTREERAVVDNLVISSVAMKYIMA